MTGSDNKYLFTSFLTNKQYSKQSTLDLKAFKSEIAKANMTLTEYAIKFYKNIKPITRELQPNEHIKYKNINILTNTYSTIIVHDKYKCQLCADFCAASKPTFGSHIIRHHKMSLEEYFKICKFTNIPVETQICPLCKCRESEFTYDWDNTSKTYNKKYLNLVCNTDECKDVISRELLGKPYNECKQEYEYIGGKTEYLCKLYNTTPEGLIKIGKSKKAKKTGTPKGFSSLQYYIDKYGVELGTSKYVERCNKIKKSLTVEWFIEKYGYNTGIEKYKERIRSAFSSYKHINSQTTSKGQLKLLKLLQTTSSDIYILNYPTINGTVDIYNETKNIIIEYYGDFWHCAKPRFLAETIHPIFKKPASEIWLKNETRINDIKDELNCNCIIIWEHSFNNINKQTLKQQINSFENLQTTKQTLWI